MRAIYGSAQIAIFPSKLMPIDMIDNSMMSEKDYTCLILCGCWAIWQERNAKKNGCSNRSLTESVCWDPPEEKGTEGKHRC